MFLQKRKFVTASLSLFTTLCVLSWRWSELDKRLPAATLDYFHSDEVHESPYSTAIREFLQRPVLSYEESVKLNSASCPTDGVNFDVDSVTQYEEKWRNISSSHVSRWRSEIATYMEEKRLKSGLSEGENGKIGRGIVMAAGDRHAAIRARTNIRLLRSYNCTLAVEIFHFEGELSDADQALLEEILSPEVTDGLDESNKVTLRIVEGVHKGDDWKAFQIKGAAIQQSSFNEILYLDTDSYLLRNPETLFESRYWEETGLLLWLDYTKSHATNPVWRLLGQQCRNEYEGESGQIAISRSRHQDLLWLVEYFAMNHREFYGFMDGDRESFRAAALLLGKKWNGPARLNAAAGIASMDVTKGGGHTMLQAGLDGKWMFVHANLIKHGHFRRPLWKRITRAAYDRFEGGTYGNIDPPNDMLGKGVKLRVDPKPRMETTMEPFEGYDKALVVVEDWDSYEELRGFEDRWFELGGVH
ncbi:hypothetical protein B2J93_8885 [Marssonina coronariae]|uniref:Glycosyltransferase family 71 protein n=1 Tax=Diplocarpon coronariae TaxID=2795749 RepID=A0A218YTA9_9HELO|nr:hypothetical protein B2J93_8885 [Marssonina coronariae]